ncbi:glycoside hydrolase family 3 N-terminal domain-containing protein [Sulfurimonas autotrophica]|uniref:beta-N-acetylhexosaminidase n=1 Tax=Sulfurimonas autotrophica (strain ATCC BAA-671 / DSM 16294 / JCM 11897 / OK10) TaxID=563040 RepID=E0URH5_SULAO|nr:glycoside hydrolase family 3 N-terminal domain-containing protein [Sulfurimonas autotrophica]ADN10061.1 glycoside hydrolase family 3 domain protein [Sulfurimonas autotrophica DSM 16294]
MKIFLLLLTLFTALIAAQPTDTQLKKMIGRMLIVGFDESYIEPQSQIVSDIQQYDLGGVILFDKFYTDRQRAKNILSPYQLKKLTQHLKYFSKKPLFIAVDQEGGKVARLKPKYGFIKIPSAYAVSCMPLQKAEKIYDTQAQILEDAGINMNFAPVVDLSINPNNKVIVALERSYGSDPKEVVKYAQTMIDVQTKHNVISVLKHFPGHGSSVGDSHKGFVDITHTWQEKELEPYKLFINTGKADTIMTAHVFNAHLDDKYPATLSYKTNTKLLRNTLHFKGVIISDDMQMKAISANYSLKDAVTLAINSGVDILLFGNQLAHNSTKEIVETIFKQVKNKKIPLERIKESNARIANLHVKNAIIQKPIVFGDKRKEMTRAYIQKHYGLHVKNITIKPKVIVLHWTAVMDLTNSFNRLYPQKLLTDRKDIAKASALNVSAHYLVDRDGTIYQLMPDNVMARHVIGLNYSSIGIENVGGEANKKEDLTPAQVRSNIALVKYLKQKYPNISYLIGHYEYTKMQNNPLWLERDAGYRTKKADPGEEFMQKVRHGVKNLHLKGANE